MKNNDKAYVLELIIVYITGIDILFLKLWNLYLIKYLYTIVVQE